MRRLSFRLVCCMNAGHGNKIVVHVQYYADVAGGVGFKTLRTLNVY